LRISDGGGEVHDYGILRARGGYLRLEIRRHGGISQVDFTGGISGVESVE